MTEFDSSLWSGREAPPVRAVDHEETIPSAIKRELRAIVDSVRQVAAEETTPIVLNLTVKINYASGGGATVYANEAPLKVEGRL